MKISHISIQNFRALQSVSFPVHPFSILIGENDVGKTSVLRALSHFYEGKKISSRDEWYRRESNQPIEISVTYSDLPEEDTDVQKLAEDGKMKVVKRFEIGVLPKTFAIVRGEEVKVDKSVIINWFSSENFIFIPEYRGVVAQFAKTKTALLGRLLRRKMASALQNPDAAGHIQMVESALSESLRVYQTQLGEYMREQAHNQEIQLEFGDINIDPVEGVDFRTLVSDRLIDKTPIENRGAGTQNNLIIALFRLAAQEDAVQNVIFALEEPENSLHPKAQRQLFAAIQGLAEKTQTIVTTHSAVFIDRANYGGNIWLTRNPKTGGTQARPFDESMLENVRVDMGIRASDALLKGGGNCAILVEGYTEEDAFPVFMKMMDMSVFSLGVSIINLEGGDAEKFSHATKLMQAFSIPCVAVLDGDNEGLQTARDLDRAMKQGDGLPNLKGVFALEKGKIIEDYFPLSIVANVMNQYLLTPPKKVQESDFDANKSGEARISDFRHVMHKNKAGKSVHYLKRMLGLHGAPKMKEVPEPLKPMFERVKEIANGGE